MKAGPIYGIGLADSAAGVHCGAVRAYVYLAVMPHQVRLPDAPGDPARLPADESTVPFLLVVIGRGTYISCEWGQT